MKMYFVWHWDEGFSTHETEDEAREKAESLFEMDNEFFSSEGFDEDCYGVAWGKISQQSRMYETGEKVEFEGDMVDCVNVEWFPKQI